MNEAAPNGADVWRQLYAPPKKKDRRARPGRRPARVPRGHATALLQTNASERPALPKTKLLYDELFGVPALEEARRDAFMDAMAAGYEAGSELTGAKAGMACIGLTDARQEGFAVGLRLGVQHSRRLKNAQQQRAAEVWL